MFGDRIFDDFDLQMSLSRVYIRLLLEMTNSTLPTILPARSWRDDALAIIDALFPVTTPSVWDDLLELRQTLVAGQDWDRVLDLFLVCRKQLELDHYLPFFRLRRLLSSSLRLEAGVNSFTAADPDLALLLARQPRSLDEITRSLRRELFEHELDLDDLNGLQLTVVERLS